MSAAGAPFGQVARRCGRFAARVFNLVFRAAVGLLLVAAVALALLFSRLSDGPLPLPWLAGALERAANTPGQAGRVAIGGVALIWDGTGLDRPLDLHLSAITLTDVAGGRMVALPEATVGLSIRALLLGRIAVRSVALGGLDVRLVRAADGSIGLDPGAEAEPRTSAGQAGEAADRGSAGGAALSYALRLLTGPDDGPFGRHQLRRVSLRNARVSIADAELGASWSLPDLDLDLRRSGGGLEAQGRATLHLGAETVPLGVAGQWSPGDGGAALALRIARARPASLAAATPKLAPLAMLDADVAATMRLTLDPRFRRTSTAFGVQVSAGRIVVPGGAAIPIRGGAVELTATPEKVELTRAALRLDGAGAVPVPVVSASALLRLGEAPTLSLTATLPRLDLAGLARVWPEGLGGNERAWLVGNLTAGVVSDLALTLEASLPADLSGLSPRQLGVTGRVEGVSVHYLRPMPPAEDARGTFHVDLDRAEVVVDGARVGRSVQGRGTVRITGLSGDPQLADIALDIGAPVDSVLGLLQHARLKLFETRPLPAAVRDATGTASAKLSLRFPLLDALPVEEVRVAVEAEVTDARLPKLLAGQDVTDGRLSLAVGNDGLRLRGQVRLAGTPLAVTYDQDFRSGPANQVVERLRAEGKAEERLLAAFGLGSDGSLTGAPATTVQLAIRRNGQGEAAIRADLRAARIAIPLAGYEKPEGQPGSAEATLRMARERITAIDNVRVEAPDLAARGRIGFAEGVPDRITLASLVIGRTRAAGEVVLGRDGTIGVTARGAELDASALFRPAPTPPRTGHEPPSPGPPLRLDLGFERVWLANQKSVEAVSMRLDRRAGRIEQLSVSGRTGPDQPFEATVARRADHRGLLLRASDAGAFLAATDVITSMAGGRLALEGRFEEPTDLLSGSAEITDFRVRDAPAIGRLLQAMTLYGLVDLARGPGLAFSRLTAPFTWRGGVLTLADARAFSPSLGVTVKGSIDTNARQLALEGTLVPAYFFNSLLGNIPLIGRLFSPERGGGVFAATYSVSGPMADPQVSVNPLAALTPGFLRGLFGIFDSPSAPAPEGTAAPSAPAATVPGAAATDAQPPAARPAAPPAVPPAAPRSPGPVMPPPGGVGSSGVPPG